MDKLDKKQILELLKQVGNDKELLKEAGFKVGGRPPKAKNIKPDYVEIEADKADELVISEKVVKQLEDKPKKVLSDAQKASLEKGRIALMERYKKLKEERETKKNTDDVVRIKSLVKDASKKTILIKVKGKTRKARPEPVETKRVQREISDDEDEPEEIEDTTEIETTESELSDAPRVIRKINKRVNALKKVETKLAAVQQNPVNVANPYSKFLKW
jgi:hypothetical protein